MEFNSGFKGLIASLGGFLRFEPRVVKLIGKSVGRAPSLRVIPWYLFALQLGKKHGNTSFRVRKILSCTENPQSGHGKTSGTEKPQSGFVPLPLFLLFRPLSSNFAGFVCLCTVHSSVHLASGPPLLSLHVNK